VPVRDAVPDFADELVGRIEDTEQLAAAQRALAALRRSDREVFMLCVWSGLDYAAAAEALGVPVGTVRSRLSRARARLRQLAQKEREHGREPLGRSGQHRVGRVETSRSTEERHR
jgi:RNA polymerase sigma-70 factor (ECF subfamily)